MTTKARIEALQWFHDRGEVEYSWRNGGPSQRMLELMYSQGQITRRVEGRKFFHSLTDKGRQDLHEATR